MLKSERLGVNDGPGEAESDCCASSASISVAPRSV